jgi:tRNA (guanine37-N1)-methyltransferase
MKFHIITLFPESFDSYLNESILARAKKNKLIKVDFYNPRKFVKPNKTQIKNANPYLRIDDKPYGGGPGMIIMAEPILKTLTFIKNKINKNKKNLEKEISKSAKKSSKIKIIHFSPFGKKLNNSYATNLVNKYDHLIIICGRYEGIDARVKKIFKGDEISVGDYVLTGGELPAMILIDVVSRHIEGVLGNFQSIEENRCSSREFYTRPEILNFNNKKYKVPKILLSGHHAKITKWRLDN